jgi:putative endonuclease
MLHFRPSMALDRRGAFGKRGEDLACEELRQRGYAILERRFRTRFGEIDIVARDGQIIAFVEVKARSNSKFGTPLESITWQKRQRLGRMAAQYLSWKGLHRAGCRFDVVAITEEAGTRIEVIRNAFDGFELNG